MSAKCNVIVFLPVYGQFAAIRKPHSGRIVYKTYIFINSILQKLKTELKYLEHSSHTFALKVMKRAASCKHRQAVKTIQCEKKLFKSHLGK